MELCEMSGAKNSSNCLTGDNKNIRNLALAYLQQYTIAEEYSWLTRILEKWYLYSG
ncbi:unnamed protein product [Rhodiola kirilowii]